MVAIEVVVAAMEAEVLAKDLAIAMVAAKPEAMADCFRKDRRAGVALGGWGGG